MPVGEEEHWDSDSILLELETQNRTQNTVVPEISPFSPENALATQATTVAQFRFRTLSESVLPLGLSGFHPLRDCGWNDESRDVDKHKCDRAHITNV
jgi:hypothetical protein